MTVFKVIERSKESGSTKSLLKKGMIPGIIYGKNSESSKIAFENKILQKLMHSGGFYSKIIDLEINGYSEDGRFFSLFQNFYDNNGNHLAHLDLAFGLINTDTRKLTSMPEASFEIFKNYSKSDSFKILTKEDMRKHGKFPKNYINEQ